VSFHLVFLLAYSLFLLVLGLWLGSYVKGAGDFFVAGRRLGPGLLFATLLAANIGAGSTVGATGLAYREGLSAWWWNGSAGLGSILLALWIGPRIWREATRRGYLTVGDFLEDRYGRSVRGIVAALLWLGTLAILAGQFLGMSRILEVVAGLPKPVGCALGGVLVTAYFAAGGLFGSAWVNLVQLTVKIAGFALALPVVLGRVGGIDGIAAASPAGSGYTAFWGPSSAPLLFLMVPAFMISPGLIQKAYGARDERAVRTGIGANGLALLAFGLVPALLGMAARTLHPSLPNQELALPTLMVHDLPPLVGGLALAAVFSAEISAADAILFMLATSLSQDLYRRFLSPAASDARVLLVARGAAVAGGAAGVLLAIFSPTIIAALGVFYALLGVTLFVPVVAGLHLRRTGAPEALASVGAGLALTLGFRLTGIARAGVFTPELGGILAALLAFAVVATLRSRLTGAAAARPLARGPGDASRPPGSPG
jgi:solute:Na+ symporter, SSS family